MKPIRCDLNNADEVEIHMMADQHLGDPACDYRRIREKIDYILNTPNTYCVLGGDLMDAAVKASIGDCYSAALQPMEQLHTCVEIFKPLADEKKILCCVPGNHEERIYRQDGVDMTSLMCSQLNIADRYSPTSALLFIRFGYDKTVGRRHRPVCYTGYVNHGSGGGRRPGSKINKLSDLAGIVDADFYLHFHTHLPVVFRESYFRVSASNSTVAQVDKLFINGAAALDYGGYGDRQAFKPASKESPVLYLSGTHKRMWAKL